MKLDHIGIVVDDIEEAKKFLGEVLGLPQTREFAIPERKLQGVFFSLGNASIEVIQIDNEEERRQRLGDGASARIEHIGIAVDDVDATYADLQKRGIEPKTPAPVIIRYSRSFFTKPETSDGVSYQFLTDLAKPQ